MKKILIFLAGGLVGFVGPKFLQSNDFEETVGVVASSECKEAKPHISDSEKPQDNETSTRSAQNLVRAPKPQFQEREPVHYPARANDEDQKKSRRKVLITFSEELLLAMEDEWSDLPNQARLTEEDRGWRVIFLEPNSTFSKVGLVEGDLIPRETIQNLNRMSRAPANLEDRVIHILDQITY